MITYSLRAKAKRSPGKDSSRPTSAGRGTLNAHSSAFTLIELLVVIGVITLVSALMFANIKSFGGQTQVQNLAYDIALSVREAQVYGVSVKASNTTGLYTFGNGYGISFDTSSPYSYHMFVDADHSGTFTNSTEDVAPSPYKLNNGFSVTGLYGIEPSGATNALATMSILFIRPEPNAYIYGTAMIGSGITPSCGRDSGGIETCSTGYTRGRVVLKSPRGDYMQIIIYANGQISVQPDPTGT